MPPIFFQKNINRFAKLTKAAALDLCDVYGYGLPFIYIIFVKLASFIMKALKRRY